MYPFKETASDDFAAEGTIPNTLVVIVGSVVVGKCKLNTQHTLTFWNQCGHCERILVSIFQGVCRLPEQIDWKTSNSLSATEPRSKGAHERRAQSPDKRRQAFQWSAVRLASESGVRTELELPKLRIFLLSPSQLCEFHFYTLISARTSRFKHVDDSEI